MVRFPGSYDRSRIYKSSKFMGTITVSPDLDSDPSLWFIDEHDKVEHAGKLYPTPPKPFLPPILPSKKISTRVDRDTSYKKHRLDVGTTISSVSSAISGSTLSSNAVSVSRKRKKKDSSMDERMKDIVLIDGVADAYAMEWDRREEEARLERRRQKKLVLGILDESENPYIDDFATSQLKLHMRLAKKEKAREHRLRKQVHDNVGTIHKVLQGTSALASGSISPETLRDILVDSIGMHKHDAETVLASFTNDKINLKSLISGANSSAVNALPKVSQARHGGSRRQDVYAVVSG